MHSEAMAGVGTGEQPTSCPSCGATVRRNLPWCSQCYASLQQSAEGESPVGPPESDVPQSDVPQDPPPDVDALATWLIAELAAADAPQPAWWQHLPQSPAAKSVWVAGGVVVLVGVLLALMGLLGLVL